MKPVVRSVLGAVGVFAALMVSGLVTRPLALAFPVPALHGLLMALPAAFIVTFALGHGVSVWACGIGIVAFALMLGAMSPAMGMATLLPLAIALVFYGFAKKFALRGTAPQGKVSRFPDSPPLSFSVERLNENGTPSPGVPSRLTPEACCLGAGVFAGALYFPFTLACSGSGSAYLASAGLSAAAPVVLLSLLGVALAVLGAMLASVVKKKKG